MKLNEVPLIPNCKEEKDPRKNKKQEKVKSGAEDNSEDDMESIHSGLMKNDFEKKSAIGASLTVVFIVILFFVEIIVVFFYMITINVDFQVTPSPPWEKYFIHNFPSECCYFPEVLHTAASVEIFRS